MEHFKPRLTVLVAFNSLCFRLFSYRRRQTLANGKPEPIQLWHSWDSHSRLSGYFLVNLARHADHHKYPSRPFFKLESSVKSPLLPVGYPASVLLATLPPLWYLVMHRRLDSFEQKRAEGQPKDKGHMT